MKKLLPSLIFVSFLFGNISSLKAQCRLLEDTISSGNSMTDHTAYFYNGTGQNTMRQYVDSGFTAVTGFDSIFYNAAGFFTQVDKYWTGFPSPQEVTTFARNASNQITRINVSGNNGGPFTISHDLTYNGSSELTDIIVDLTSITGTPGGFSGDFRNMVWAGGNVTNLDLVGDLGNGPETIELTFTYDSKVNIESHIIPEEASDLFIFGNANNFLVGTFDNNEISGPAGTIAISQSYTYNAQNEVITMTNNNSFFEPGSSVTEFTFNCSVGVNENVLSNNPVLIYPNPAYNSLTVSVEDAANFKVSIMNIQGKELITETYNKNVAAINIENLPIGIYVLEIRNGDQIIREKLVKK